MNMITKGWIFCFLLIIYYYTVDINNVKGLILLTNVLFIVDMFSSFFNLLGNEVIKK